MTDAVRERRKQLLQRRLSEVGLARMEPVSNPPRSEAERNRLSPGQRRMWFLQTRDPDGTALNICVGYRLVGALDAARLRTAIATVVARHEILRTTYRVDGGEPHQVFHPDAEFSWREHDLTALPDDIRDRELENLARRASDRSFDLADDLPLRASLVRCGPAEHALILVAHHIAWDDDSWRVFFTEVNATYRDAGALSELRAQYADLPAADPAEDTEIEFWRRTLTPLPERPELPGGQPHSGTTARESGRSARLLSPELTHRVNEYARKHSVSSFTVLLSAFGALIRRYTAASDFLVAVPITDRRGQDAERLVGYFGNTLLVRFSGDPADSFDALVDSTGAAWQAAFAHRGVGIDRVIRECNPNRTPGSDGMAELVALSFGVRGDENGLSLAGIEVTALDLGGLAAQEPLGFMVVERASGATVEANFQSDVLDRALVEEMLAGYVRLLDGALGDPGRRVAAIDILGESVRAQIADVSYGADVAAGPNTLAAMFEATAAVYPDHPAISSDAGTLNYAELDRRANRLAHWFIGRGVGTEDIVALKLPNSAQFVVAALAVLKAGAAYLPIDPAYPDDRIEYLIADAQPQITLDLTALAEAEAAAGTLPATNPTDAARIRPLRSSNLAYVIYTSGSTGQPKGVPVSHGAIAEHLTGFDAQFGMTADDRLLQSSSVSFDASLLEVFVTLTLGAHLIIGKPDTFTDIPYLSDMIARYDVTVLHMVPSLLSTLLQLPELREWHTLRFVPVGGEALPGEVADRLVTEFGVRLRNHYGPTEAVVSSTHYEVDTPQGHRVVPIGRPNLGVSVHLLDSALELVPFGTIGEVYLGGDQLARGYLDRPGLSVARFVADPFRPGGRLCRTGDLARRNRDGLLEFVGRADDQMKIRGYRIEAGEVEAALSAHPDVAHAVVIVTEHAAVGRMLTAYLVGESAGSPIDFAEVRAHIAAKLPAYMVPAAFAEIDRIPITAHGKLDRRALPAPVLVGARRHRAPSAGVEARMAAVFERIFELDSVGADDSFFELGGHSLLAVRLIAEIRAEFGVELEVRAAFDTPTVAELAAQVDEQHRGESGMDTGTERPDTLGPIAPTVDAGKPELVAGQRPEHIPLSYPQLMMWLPSQLDHDEPVGNLPYVVRLDGPVDTGVLAAAIGDVIARHEALRTTFPNRDGVPYQRILPSAPIDVPVIAVVDEQRLSDRLSSEFRYRFAVDSELLIRPRIFVLDETRHMLSLLMHHLVTDHVSFGVFLTDLIHAYRARIQTGHPDRAPLRIQYADYALWQRAAFDEKGIPYGQTEIEYWRAALAGLPAEITVPLDRPRPATLSANSKGVSFTVPASLWTRLRALAAETGVTEYMVCQAALVTVLHKLGAGDDIAIGTPVAGRVDAATNDLVGMFANVVVVRTGLAGNPTLRSVLMRGRDAALGAFSHQEVPIERVMDALGPVRLRSRNPLYQVVLHFRAQDWAQRALDLTPSGGTRLVPEPLGFDDSLLDFIDNSFLDVNVGFTVRADGRVDAKVVYHADLYDKATAELVADGLLAVLAAFASTPDIAVGDVEVLAAAERQRVLAEWSTGSETGQVHSIPEIVAAIENTPADRVAVYCGTQTVTYGELCLRIHSAGGGRTAGRPDGADTAWSLLDPAIDLIGSLARASFVSVPVGDASLALSRRALESRIGSRIDGERGTQLVALGSDSLDIVVELLAAMAAEATIVLATPAECEDSDALARLITDYEPTLVVADPHILSTITHGGLTATPSVRTWVVAAPAWPVQLPGLLSALAPESRAWFRYGFAEAGGAAVYGPVTAVSKGRPAPGTRLLVLDDRLRPVPHGVIGDIYVGGSSLAIGYLNDRSATAVRFVADPYATHPGAWLFRTGKRGRWDVTGSLVLETAPLTVAASSFPADTDTTPVTETERTLIAILEELLELTEIGRHDGFFELGGDSVMSIQWAAKANQVGLPLTPPMVFEHITIAELAAAVDEAPQDEEQSVAGDRAHQPMTVSGLSDDALAAVTAAWKVQR